MEKHPSGNTVADRMRVVDLLFNMDRGPKTSLILVVIEPIDDDPDRNATISVVSNGLGPTTTHEIIRDLLADMDEKMPPEH